MEWLRERMLGEGKIGAGDLGLLQVTDDPREVLEIVSAATHRQARDPTRQDAFPADATG